MPRGKASYEGSLQSLKQTGADWSTTGAKLGSTPLLQLSPPPPFRGGGVTGAAASGAAQELEQSNGADAMTETVAIGDYAAIKAGDDQPTRTWPNSYGTYLAGRSYLDEADAVAIEMEDKWGAGRLRLLVSPELREKFDRQRYWLNQSIWHGQGVENVRREAGRMVKAWLALDRAATAAGKQPLDPMVWEVVLPDGSVAAIVPSDSHTGCVRAEGRKVAVYTLEEIARLLSHDRALFTAKMTFPGATVTAVRKTVPDPLDSFDSAARPLDEPFDDELPF